MSIAIFSPLFFTVTCSKVHDMKGLYTHTHTHTGLHAFKTPFKTYNDIAYILHMNAYSFI